MTDLCEQPLGLLCEVIRRELVHLLESLPGMKDLVVDATLLRPLDRIASMSLLQKHGCQRVIPLRLNSPNAIPWHPNVMRRVYLLRSSLDIARLLAEHVRASPDKHIAVIWVDRRLVVCERELERQGVYGLIESFELSISFISIENDLFSMEMPITTAHKDLLASANALFQLQSLYGLIPTVYGLGEQTEKLWKLMHHVYMERGEPRSSPDQPISHLFMFDRSLDQATVLMTGLTYEAMLHEVFTIGCGKISFGPEVEEKNATRDRARRSGEKIESLRA
ncbi:hypothetical protein COOONC_09801 [Cooperia oncophora]